MPQERPTTAVVVVVAAMVALVGCTDSGVPHEVSPTVADPQVSPAPASNGLDGLPQPAPLQWSAAVASDPGYASYALVASTRVVAYQNTADGRQSVIEYRPDGASRFEADPGEYVQGVFAIGDALVFELGSEATGNARVVAWDPVTGDNAVVLAVDDYWPEVVVAGDTLYYTAVTPPAAMCVRALDITDPFAPGGGEDVYCAGPDMEIGWLVRANAVVSFLEHPSDSPCSDVLMIEPGVNSVTRIDLDECALHAVGTSQGIAWTPPLPDAEDRSYFHLSLSVTTASETIALGDSVAGSATWCAGWLYWTTDGDAALAGAAEIRRWRPGAQAEAVYRSPDAETQDGYVTSAPACSADGRVYFQRVGVVSSLTDLLVYPALEWGVDFR